MVRAIINGDELVKLTMKSDLGIEIGTLSAADLHRFRWDGKKLIDITKAESLHVEYGTFKLHVVPMNNTQEVTMVYNDRKILKNDKGTIRLKTDDELELEQLLDYQRKRKAEYPGLDTQLGELMKFVSDKFYDDPDMTSGLKAILHDIDVVKDKHTKTCGCPVSAACGPDCRIPSAARVPLKPH